MTPQQIPQETFVVVLIVMALVFGLSAWVALDAHERGHPKVVCMMWYFAILIFTPVILLYLVMRAYEMSAAAKKPQSQTPVAVNVCPYCSEAVPPGVRVCPKCQRLL